MNASLILRIFRKVRKILARSSKKYNDSSLALHHNSLDNVDTLNQKFEHWEKCLKNDKIFINAIYSDIILLTQINSTQRIADFGCGTGVLVDKLMSDFPNGDIRGYDFSVSKIRWCCEYYNQSCFSSRSIYDPLDSKYDVIIATEVLEHLEYPKKALNNLLSGMASEGRLFVTVPDGRKDNYSGHIHFWSPESWALFIYESVDSIYQIKLGKLADKNYALITCPIEV